MSVAYLFRNYNDMPVIEQKALQLAKGKILDVGCGAGSHALYLQNSKHHQVTAIDISPAAIAACSLRGLKDARVQDVMTLENEKFDTILLLMNGAGMCGKFEKLDVFIKKLKSLLHVGGQIILDSSDIIYMFDESEDGTKQLPSNQNYYGELQFTISYKGELEKAFDWMFIDSNNLKKIALQNQFTFELLVEGEHYDYLARLSR
jgi:cyclopropane fatty-acyl-phospholipid synthase-like methyltransferase